MTSKVSFSNITSERYALALYELAKEGSELDKTETEVKGLKQLITSSPDFKNMISDPTISREIQSKVMETIGNKFNFSATFKKFLGFISSKGRLFFLEKISDNFLNLISKNKGEIIANLVSSKELSNQDLQIIEKDLAENFKSKIKINYKFDPSLIGGLVIKVGSIMIDASLKNKLKRLEKIMVEK